jgi:putative copper export protein
MVCIAVVNRLWLSPWLAVDGVSRKLERNSLIEAGLGAMIVVIVGALGILVPALQTHAGHLH